MRIVKCDIIVSQTNWSDPRLIYHLKKKPALLPDGVDAQPYAAGAHPIMPKRKGIMQIHGPIDPISIFFFFFYLLTTYILPVGSIWTFCRHCCGSAAHGARLWNVSQELGPSDQVAWEVFGKVVPGV